MGFNNGFGAMPPHMMYQQQMQMQMYQQPIANGQPMPFGTQTPGNATPSSGGQTKYPKTGSPNKNGQRYEKKDKNNSAQKSAKKGDKTEQKKYVTKQKKDKNEDSAAKASSDKKPVENVASAWAQEVSIWHLSRMIENWPILLIIKISATIINAKCWRNDAIWPNAKPVVKLLLMTMTLWGAQCI